MAAHNQRFAFSASHGIKRVGAGDVRHGRGGALARRA